MRGQFVQIAGGEIFGHRPDLPIDHLQAFKQLPFGHPTVAFLPPQRLGDALIPRDQFRQMIGEQPADFKGGRLVGIDAFAPAERHHIDPEALMHFQPALPLAWSPDGTALLAHVADGPVVIVDVESGAIVSGFVVRFLAYARLVSTSAAPPSLVAQIWSRRSGSETFAEASTSSTL